MGEIASAAAACSNNMVNQGNGNRKGCWYEEEIEDNLRWCFALNSIFHTGVAQYQDIQLLDTKPFGKALVIDGKLQSAEIDEFICHESLVHPALLHSSLQDVVDFCKSYLVVNRELAFCDPRVELIINDASHDVIIGDLADPIEGSRPMLPALATPNTIVKSKLKKDGIFVTQAGPAGVFSHTEVFSCLYNTPRQVFKYVVPYSAHIPSYADMHMGGYWTMASDSPLVLNSDELDLQIKQRIVGENRFFDGKTFASASTLSKAVRKTLDNETHVYCEGSERFIHGHGSAFAAHK